VLCSTIKQKVTRIFKEIAFKEKKKEIKRKRKKKGVA
jgi:hypothetical protein